MLELTGVRPIRNGETIMSITGVLAETPPPLLKIEGLSVAYGPVMALQNVNLELRRSSLVGVIGPNGAGKSSLLKGVLGMVPSSGKISVAGQPLAQARQRISYVPQRSAVRWDFPVTAEEVVMMGRYKHIGWIKFPGKADRQIVAETLAQVGMYDLRKRQISQLAVDTMWSSSIKNIIAQSLESWLIRVPLIK